VVFFVVGSERSFPVFVFALDGLKNSDLVREMPLYSPKNNAQTP
jgi:hypothetical protein